MNEYRPDYWYWNQILVPEKKRCHFPNTIFINETEYNNREIEAEDCTRTTHVTQKTTLDILFIEL
jgi:hypothetical protein